MTLVMQTLFETKKAFKPIATGKVRDENTNFESDRTSSILEKMQTKQSLLPSKVSNSHQITSYQTYTTSKLNECINKLPLPYFNSFCQPFHIPFFHIFDQRLFCYEKLIELVHNKVFKIKKLLAPDLPLTSLFSNV